MRLREEIAMNDTNVPLRSVTVAMLRVLIPFDTVALLFAGIVHLVGARIPLGVAVFEEPPIIPAGIVEGLAGLIFALATYALFARRGRAWAGALAAHLFALAGFLLGLWATRGGTTTFNHDYHVVMLAVFVLGLALLVTPGARAALDDGAQIHPSPRSGRSSGAGNEPAHEQ
jgi:hypothetical protein